MWHVGVFVVAERKTQGVIRAQGGILFAHGKRVKPRGEVLRMINGVAFRVPRLAGPGVRAQRGGAASVKDRRVEAIDVNKPRRRGEKLDHIIYPEEMRPLLSLVVELKLLLLEQRVALFVVLALKEFGDPLLALLVQQLLLTPLALKLFFLLLELPELLLLVLLLVLRLDPLALELLLLLELLLALLVALLFLELRMVKAQHSLP